MHNFNKFRCNLGKVRLSSTRAPYLKADIFEDADERQTFFLENNMKASLSFHQYSQPEIPACEPNADSSPETVEMMDMDEQKTRQDRVYSTRSIGVSTEDDLIQEINSLRNENSSLKEQVKQLKQEINISRWSINKIKNDDRATQFYTGLPTFAVLMWLYRYLEPKACRMAFWNGEKKTTNRERSRGGKLSLLDQLLSVLMRLKVGLFVKDIADRFEISVGTFSKIFHTWIVFLNKELTVLNPFPSKEMVQRFLPPCFSKYPKTRIIIDCTEIFLDKPSALSAQNETFSNYKHHNTVKFLVGISPGGVFTFISKGWGGRVSDREIVKRSGFLELIEPGDNVMADKGFVIEDLLHDRHASLNIPPFLKQQAQFTQEQVQQTRDIAEVRIHVERAIGRLKKFHILDGCLPLSLETILTDIVRVCAYLTNLFPPIVPRD